MIAALLLETAMAAAGAAPEPNALVVMFPDQINPNYYNVMSCHGKLREHTRVRAGKDGAPVPKSGRVVFRCDGPLDTYIERIPYEPTYFQDTDWTWSFEGPDGRELLGGVGAKLMNPVAQGLHFYVREGYAEP